MTPPPMGLSVEAKYYGIRNMEGGGLPKYYDLTPNKLLCSFQKIFENSSKYKQQIQNAHKTTKHAQKAIKYEPNQVLSDF